MPSRTIAIGDIHGCSKALSALVAAVGPSKEDLLIPLGDFVDYGPDSKAVIEQLIALRQRCRLVPIFGNHEEMLLMALHDTTMLDGWLSSGGRATLRSYGSLKAIPQEHLEFLMICRLFFETDTHIFVHANYVPNVPMQKQSDAYMRWEFLGTEPPAPHCSGKTVVVGHTPQQIGEILDLGHLICIDTHCSGGKWLTAFEVNSKQVWQANKWGKMRER